MNVSGSGNPNLTKLTDINAERELKGIGVNLEDRNASNSKKTRKETFNKLINTAQREFTGRGKFHLLNKLEKNVTDLTAIAQRTNFNKDQKDTIQTSINEMKLICNYLKINGIKYNNPKLEKLETELDELEKEIANDEPKSLPVQESVSLTQPNPNEGFHDALKHLLYLSKQDKRFNQALGKNLRQHSSENKKLTNLEKNDKITEKQLLEDLKIIKKGLVDSGQAS